MSFWADGGKRGQEAERSGDSFGFSGFAVSLSYSESIAVSGENTISTSDEKNLRSGDLSLIITVPLEVIRSDATESNEGLLRLSNFTIILLDDDPLPFDAKSRSWKAFQ